eukprot:GILI01007986.1.p1 GENE.GILI01007986.1~~GILI01007986.1.p1  ORF type:complete len:635 (-),score=167.30 GILI01007986.1:40-1944(-)
MASTSFLSAFDKTGDNYATISADNRLKIWDTVSGGLRQEFVESNHLTAVYTCIAWGCSLSGAAGKSKKAKSSGSALVALGRQDGTIVIWDTRTGEIVSRLGDGGQGHSQRVNDVVFNSTGSLLYSCAEDKVILEWNVASGEVIHAFKKEKSAVKKLALSSDDALLVAAGTRVLMWDLASKSCVQRCTGHATAVTSLRISADKRLVVSCSEDRFINLWTVTSSSSASEGEALQVLTVESNPTHLDLLEVPVVEAKKSKKGKGAESQYMVAAVTRQGKACLWLLSSSGQPLSSSASSEGPVSAHCVVSVAASSSPVGITGGLLLGSGSLLAVKGEVRPVFERVLLTDVSGSLLPEVSLAAPSAGLLMPEGPAKLSATAPKKGKQGAEAVLTPAEAGAVARPTSLEVEQQVKPTKGEGEASLQERVASMSLDAASSKQPSSQGPPKASSLQSLLSQALSAGDDSLLEHCLSVADRGVVQATVRRLPTHLVPRLLEQLVSRFHARPTRGLQLSMWLKATLIQHSSWLLSSPDSVRYLSPLYQTVDSRLQVFKKLLKLYGRLDLVLSQISMRAAAEDEDLAVADKPLVVYHEGEENDVEEEDILVDEAGSDEDDGSGDDDDLDGESGDDGDMDDEDDEM